MEHYVGLDVSLKLTAICIVDQTGRIEREGVVASNPEAIAAFIKSHAPHVARMFAVRLRYGPLRQWPSPGTVGPIAPKASLAGSGLFPAVCYGTNQCAPSSAWKLVTPESNDPEIAAVATTPRGRSILMIAARKIAAIGRATTK
jgi:hypothetical protein